MREVATRRGRDEQLATPAANTNRTSASWPVRLLLTLAPMLIAATGPGVQGPWLDPDSRPLPFKTDEEVLEFLRAADVIEIDQLGTGITKPRRLVLDKDGLRMRAIFHDVEFSMRAIFHDVEFSKEWTRIGDRFFVLFSDSWRSQIAAYELARLLALDNVPPTAVRTVGDTQGSVQVWLENAVSDTERSRQGIQPPSASSWHKQMQVMRVFDNLIFNDDRNSGNVMADLSTWKLWMIDHTRAFQRTGTLRNPEQVLKCERGLWERLQTLDERKVRDTLEPYLEKDQIGALLKRRSLLAEHIRALILERGEAAVLYRRDQAEDGIDNPRSPESYSTPGRVIGGMHGIAEDPRAVLVGAARQGESSNRLPTFERRWLGPDDEVLPFRNDDEILEFMRTAEIVDIRDLGIGVTRPRLAVLERDGVRMRAIFHDVAIERERIWINERFYMHFKDHWRSQIAAYRVARLLGLDNVPPTVERQIDRVRGSLQAWIENGMSDTDRVEGKIQPPNYRRFLQDRRVMRVFDNLIYNDDRNTGNVVIGPEWKYWMVDHTRAFQQDSDLRDPDQVSQIELHFWQRLQALTEEEVRAAVSDHLDGQEIEALMQRHEKLVDLIEELIDKRGEAAVIFDWSEGRGGQLEDDNRRRVGVTSRVPATVRSAARPAYAVPLLSLAAAAR